MVKLTGNKLIARVRLVLWFQMMAIWSIFSTGVGTKVIGAYIKEEQKKIDDKIDKLHK